MRTIHDDADLRAEAMQESRERARLNHWCSECHGHTGPGSPCAVDEEPQEDDSPYCECNAEPTISELEDGRCDACGKEIA
jgi:hypothetical protein